MTPPRHHPPIASVGAPSGLAQETEVPAALMMRVQDYLGDLRGARARKTLLALANGVRLFRAWCEVHGHSWLPTTAEAVRGFIAHIGDQPFRRRTIAGKIIETGPVAAASLRQYLWAVGVLHRAAELPDPTKSGRVALAVDAFERAHRVRQKQAPALTRAISDTILAGIDASIAEAQSDDAPVSVYDLRDRALILTWRDTMARVSEVVALQWEDIQPNPLDQSGSIEIRRSKTDQRGEGHMRFLSARTMAALAAWRTAHERIISDATPKQQLAIAAAHREPGALPADSAVFIGVHRAGITPLSTTAAVQKLNERAVDAGVLRRFSGHSIRVGTAQDLIAGGQEIAAIAQAGGWKDVKMVLRYGERLLTDRSAVARAEAERSDFS